MLYCRPPVREAWTKPPLPPGVSLYRSTDTLHHCHPNTSTATPITPITLPHPLHTATTTAPPITPITLSHSPPSTKEHTAPLLQQQSQPTPAHQDRVDPLTTTANDSTLDTSNLFPSTHPLPTRTSQTTPIPPLSITAYDSTVDHSRVSLLEDSSQFHSRQTARVHYIPVSTSLPTDIQCVQVAATSGDGEEDDRGANTSDVEDCRGIVRYAGPLVQAPPSSPPLVEPPSVDTSHSSRYSTWSEDETHTKLSPVTAGVAGDPSSPRQPPVGSDRISTLPLPSKTPTLPALTPPTLSPHPFTPSQPPLSTSQLTTSILTPSTVTGYSLTSISSLPTPSPFGQSGQDTGSRPMEINSCPIGQVGTSQENATAGHNQDIDTHCPNLFESGSTASLPRPNLSMATEDTETMPLGQRTSQDTTPCPDISIETAQSLDTTPTHATLRLPADSQSDSSTTTPQLPPHSVKSFDISSQLPSPLYPSSSQTAGSLTIHTLSTSAPSSSSGPLSLQEAFLRRKADFVKHSQKRSEQVKINASERRIQSSLKDDSTQKRSTILSHSRQKAKKHFEKTARKSPSSKLHPLSQPPSSSTKYPLTGKSDGVGGKENRRRAVTFSSPVLCSSYNSGMFSPPLEHQGL